MLYQVANERRNELLGLLDNALQSNGSKGDSAAAKVSERTEWRTVVEHIRLGEALRQRLVLLPRKRSVVAVFRHVDGLVCGVKVHYSVSPPHMRCHTGRRYNDA